MGAEALSRREERQTRLGRVRRGQAVCELAWVDERIDGEGSEIEEGAGSEGQPGVALLDHSGDGLPA